MFAEALTSSALGLSELVELVPNLGVQDSDGLQRVSINGIFPLGRVRLLILLLMKATQPIGKRGVVPRTTLQTDDRFGQGSLRDWKDSLERPGPPGGLTTAAFTCRNVGPMWLIPKLWIGGCSLSVLPTIAPLFTLAQPPLSSEGYL